MPIQMDTSTGTSISSGITVGGWTVNGNYDSGILAGRITGSVITQMNQGNTIHPQLYFTYIKKKFSILERIRLDRKIKILEKAFNHAAGSGQELLSSKILNQITLFARESAMSAKGIKWKISYNDLNKHKRNIRGGHISDTRFEDYTRVIPKKVLDKKKTLEGIFDSYVIYHYYSPEQEDVKSMSQEERAKMRDPVLFGRINESNDLYFVADWEDEYCDLTFDEMLEAMDKEYSEVKLSDKPDLTS